MMHFKLILIMSSRILRGYFSDSKRQRFGSTLSTVTTKKKKNKRKNKLSKLEKYCEIKRDKIGLKIYSDINYFSILSSSELRN